MYVSEMADECGVNPRDITSIIYCRLVDVGRIPLVGRRRQIPQDMVGDFQRELTRLGKIEPSIVELIQGESV